MRKTVCFFCLPVFICLLMNSQVQAQDTSSLDLNTLSAPLSPGSMLLGANPSDIQKPTDLSGLMMAVRNATNDFAKFPTSFSVDIAPWWLFGAKNINYNDFIGNKKTFAQTFNFSYAQDAQSDSNYYGLKQGIGVSFSLARGRIVDSEYFHKINSIRNILSELLQLNFEKVKDLRRNADEQYQSLLSRYNALLAQAGSMHNDTGAASVAARALFTNQLIDLGDKLQSREGQIGLQAKDYVDSLETEKLDQLKELEQTIIPVRKGFFFTVAGGTIVNYGSFKANASTVTNSSVWVNFGYDGLGADTAGGSYFSIAALSRLTGKNSDELYKYGIDDRHTTWDNGIKIAFTTASQKFSFSGEGISRKLFKAEEGQDFVFKYAFNIDWSVAKNARLTFSYGRDFSNHVTKDGNVIGYINFAKGLFNKKPISRGSTGE